VPEFEAGTTGRSLKRLLIVSREFPPSRTIAGQRVGAFAKFLPENGVTVHVITERESESDAPLQTLALKQVLPDCAGADSKISYVSGAADGERFVLRMCKCLNNVTHFGKTLSLLVAAARKPFSAYSFYTYGEHNTWVRQAVQQATAVARETPFDGVLASSGGEYWNLGTASRISRRLNIPLILDFRDGWDWFFGFNGKRSRIYPMMCNFVSRSSLITGATQSVIDRLLEFWPDAPVKVVLNGFDIDDESFAIGSKSPSHSGLTIGYFGTVWSNPRWSLLCQALSQTAKTVPLRIIYRGKDPEQFLQEFLSGDERPAGITFDVRGPCERDEIVRLYGEVDMVVAAALHEKQSMGAIPAKLIEAIGFTKPVIVLGDRRPDYLHGFLSDCSSPYLLVDDETGLETIALFVRALRHRASGPTKPPPPYSARHRACQLAAALDGVLN